MRPSPPAHVRTLLLLGALLAVGVGCDNAVDQRIPDPQATPEGWTRVWSDEFDGTALDTTRWAVQTGDGCPDLCGWGNNEFQSYRPENLAVGDGVLTITARREIAGDDTTYTSARVRTKDRGDWRYGRFEIRAKLPTGQGIWPAIWMLPTDEVYGAWAASGEIDIMEAIGSETGEIFGTLHYGATFPGNVSSTEAFQLAAGTYADDFFVYTVEWEEGEIRWYINNVLYATQNEWYSEGVEFPAPFDQPFHLLLNVAVGGNLPGPPAATTAFPQSMEVDYVRVYERTE